MSNDNNSVLEQISLSYDQDQDRILLRIGLSENKEIGVWLTRRIAKEIWTWLYGTSTENDILTTSSVEGKIEVAKGNDAEDKRPKLIAPSQISREALQMATPKVDFNVQYQSTRVAVFSEPMLAKEMKIVTDNETMFSMSLKGKSGQNVHVNLNPDFKMAFCNMLQLIVKEAVWNFGIETASQQLMVSPVTNPINKILH